MKTLAEWSQQSLSTDAVPRESLYTLLCTLRVTTGAGSLDDSLVGDA